MSTRTQEQEHKNAKNAQKTRTKTLNRWEKRKAIVAFIEMTFIDITLH